MRSGLCGRPLKPPGIRARLFQLGCAERGEKNEAQLREALANPNTDPDEGTAVHATSRPDAGC